MFNGRPKFLNLIERIRPFSSFSASKSILDTDMKCDSDVKLEFTPLDEALPPINPCKPIHKNGMVGWNNHIEIWNFVFAYFANQLTVFASVSRKFKK